MSETTSATAQESSGAPAERDTPVYSDAAGIPTDTSDDSVPELPGDRSEQTPEDLALTGDVEEALRDVVDPELGINVVDLGLIYDIWIEDKSIARVDMTLTSAACPLTDVIEDQARAAVVGSDICSDLKINWVWMPPWGPEHITEDGREQLRALGFSI